MVRHRPKRWAAIAAATLLAPFAAQAQPVSHYLAPPECPSAAWFHRELTRRLGSRDAPSPIAVEIRPAEGGFFGRVRVGETAESEIVREVRHESCEQVARALALIAAVLEETSAPPPAPGELVRPPTPALPVAPPPAPAPARSLAPASWRWRTGPSVSLGLMSAVAPIVLAGPRAGWELTAEEPLRRYGYVVGVSLGRLATGTRPYELGTAKLTWSAIRFEGCAFIRPSRRLALAPCVFADAGELRGEGTSTITRRPIERASLWLAPGLGARGEWQLIGPLAFRLEAGGFFPLWPATFYFPGSDGQRRENIHQVPGAGLTVECGLSARLP